MRGRAEQLWVSWFGPALVAFFLAASIALSLLRHAAFQTNLLDLGYYTQVIWNTAHGRWFATSLKPPSYLGDHFSPVLVLVAPLFWVVPDARALLVIELVALVSAVLPAYLLCRGKHPVLAPLLVLAFVLNPLVHQSAGHEFHEVMLAVPTLALSAFALATRRDRLLWLGLALTLLVREDMAVYVASFGLHLLVCRPGRRWQGLAVIGASAAWLLLLTGWVIPGLGDGTYQHASLFARFGETVPEILLSIVRNPWNVVEPIAAAFGNGALLLWLLPIAGLALLARGEQLLWVPGLLFLLLSEDPYVSRLQSWHLAPLIPLLWVSVAAALARLRPRPAALAAGLLVATAVVGFFLWSPFPGGGRYQPSTYQVTAHSQTGHQVLAVVPKDVSLATQSGLGAHLGARASLFLFPWFDWGAPPDMILLDGGTREPYPLSSTELQSAILQFQMQPEVEVLWEQDGYYLFKLDSPSGALHQGPWSWGSILELEGYALAQSCGTGAFQAVADDLKAGCGLRVQLYWKAIAPLEADYSISVRLLDSSMQVVAQDDGRPAQGALNTMAWSAGRSIRDTHYLPIAPSSTPADLSLQVIVYDTVTLQPVDPSAGHILGPLRVIPTAAQDTPSQACVRHRCSQVAHTTLPIPAAPHPVPVP